MTLAQVEQVFGGKGESWSLQGSNFGRLTRRCWVGDGVAYLLFDEDGCLCGGEWHEDGFASPTRQHYDCLCSAMPKPLVNDLFGRPPDNAWADWEDGTEVWRDIDGEAAVHYDYDQVTEMYWNFLSDSEIEHEYRHPFQRFVRRLFIPDLMR